MRNLLISVCLFSALSWAQSYTGSIRGTITDTSKSAVPNAKITVTDSDRNVQFSTVSDFGRPVYLHDLAGGQICPYRGSGRL